MRKTEQRQALIIIDMENGFLNPESAHCIRTAADTVPTCTAVAQKAREQGIPVFFVNRIYRADGSDVEAARYAGWEQGGRAMTKNSAGAISCENPPQLSPQKGDYIIIKPRFSAFFQTELDLILRRLQIRTIFLTGTTTPNCIRTTCYDGLSLDYNVVIIEDCCSSNTEEIQRANLADMQNVGAQIISSEQFLRGDFKVIDIVSQVVEKVWQDSHAPEERI